jgi:hypothetical protein
MDSIELINKISSLRHEESPALSPELQAFINGWNNALSECVKILEDLNMFEIKIIDMLYMLFVQNKQNNM